jgi:tetratricopeptide (TPR) repeat protein
MKKQMSLMLLMASLGLHGEAPAGVSPAERRMQSARKALEQDPKSWQRLNELAMAYARRARETADPSWYGKANEAVSKSLDIEPDNFEALKARCWVLLGEHEFASALLLAKELNKRMPDDLQVYGFLVDANVELGNYDDAERAAQWMLDLRPGNVPGLTRAAYLREIFGDREGALELLNDAFVRTPATETEDRAWLLTHAAGVLRQMGKTQEAGKLLEEALRLMPDYHYALGGLAEVRMSERALAEAARLLETRYRVAPHPENLFELGRAYAAAGKASEAKDAFARFEAAAVKESEGWDNANRELIEYYLSEGAKPAEALRLAKLESGRRKDQKTMALLARAEAANGR